MAHNPDRPTVPEAAEALRAYYALPQRGNGGAVHIIIEDSNVAQRHADWCVQNARSWAEYTEQHHPSEGLKHADEDVRIARLLAAMSPTQRGKLANMSFYPWAKEKP